MNFYDFVIKILVFTLKVQNKDLHLRCWNESNWRELMWNKGHIDEATFSRLCGLLGVSVEAIRSGSRKRDLVYRRVVLSRYMNEEMGMIQEDIGRILGDMHHSCVGHYRKVYYNEIGNNAVLRGFDRMLMEGVSSI